MNDVIGDRDVVVCAAGSHARRPAQAVARPRPARATTSSTATPAWATRSPAASASRWRRSSRGPRRVVMVGDGSYLMMAQEIVTAVAGGHQADHRPGRRTTASPRSARCPRRSARSGSAPATATAPAPGGWTATCCPVDLAANAESLGADVLRASTIAELRDGPAQARGPRTAPPSSTSRPTRWRRPPSAEAWWDVPVAEAVARSRAPARPATALRGPQAPPAPYLTTRPNIRNAKESKRNERPSSTGSAEITTAGAPPGAGTGLQPGDRRPAGRGAAGRGDDVDAAVAAAKEAFLEWARPR